MSIMKKIFKISYFLLTIIFFTSVALGGAFFNFLQYKNHYTESRIITIEKGDSIEAIAEKFSSAEITPSKTSTKIALKIIDKYRSIQYGEYEVRPQEKLINVIKSMINGKSYLRKIQIPSGLTNDDIFKIIDKAEKLNGDYDKSSILEGMLFPDTYVYKAGDSKQKLVNYMRDTTIKNLKKEWARKDENLPYKSIYDALIIASIVEKEASSEDDKRKVASVFLNRIKNMQKLQSDPTVQYGVDLFFGKKVNLSRSHFLQRYPYSTYYVFGLPATAISNPSLSSIKAVLHPDTTNYNYFISMPNSTKLFFAKTYKEHLNYVGQLYRMRKEMNYRDNHANKN